MATASWHPAFCRRSFTQPILGDGVPIAGIESLAFRLAPSMPHSICSPIAGERFAAAMAFLPLSTAAYVVNRSIAQRLVQAQSPIRSVADWPIDIAKLGAHAAVPAIVAFDESLHSNIEPTHSAIESTRNPLTPPLPLSKKYSCLYTGDANGASLGARAVSTSYAVPRCHFDSLIACDLSPKSICQQALMAVTMSLARLYAVCTLYGWVRPINVESFHYTGAIRLYRQ